MNVLENYNYRDWLIKYFGIALKCNTPILEAIWMCSISDCPERVLLDSFSDPKLFRSGYSAYAYFLPIFAKNNWALVKQFPLRNGYFKTVVTKHGTVMDIWGGLYEFHTTDYKKEGCFKHFWTLVDEEVYWRTPSDTENGTTYRNWIDSLVKFIKG